ncbi:MAG TPA: hypothetical protein G4O16_05640 [Dehalococcoidia bacterium]|nr:hypothetical protein [Dehalococcoidia bacterium]
MGTNIYGKIWFLIISIIMFFIMAGCTPTATSQSPQHNTTFESPGQPIEVVSVIETFLSGQGQTVVPGGPIIEITLKNISKEPITSLNVTLEEGGPRSWDFDFDVTSSNPLPPNKRISYERRIGGGGWGGGIPYSLTINGTLESGEAFAFTWEPSD